MKLVFSIVRSDVPSPKQYTAEGERIVFGRNPDCHVVLDDPTVSGHHAEVIKLPAGQFVVRDLHSTNGTILNGLVVHEQSPVSTQDTITFGDGGPQLAILRVEDARDAHGAALGTETRALLVDLQDSTRRFGYFTAFTLCATTAGVAVLFMLLLNRVHDVRRDTQTLADSTERITEATVQIAAETEVQGETLFLQGDRIDGLDARMKELPSLKADDIFRRNGEAVFHVEVPGYFVATAFVIDAAGLFATNAHVAKDIADELLPRKSPAYVVAQGGSNRYRIVQAGYHPRYDPDKVSGGEYDVGWLKIEPPDGMRLVPTVLASDAELRQVQSGAQCCYIGFPSYHAGDYSDPTQVLARVYVGNIVRTMNALKQQVDYQHACVYEHTMYSWGGASGSPIFNADGHVIALHFAGEAVEQRVGSDVTYQKAVASAKLAVRVDRLRECLPK